jgi:ubiquinone/menaquinone biosynthesis C-methylase UbiE
MNNLCQILYRKAALLLTSMNFNKAIEAKIVFEFLEPRMGEKILDIACGNGVNVVRMANRGCKAFGIGIDERNINLAKSLAGSTDCNFQIADAEKLPYKSEVFDKITCVCALEHFKNDEGALLEMNRVIKPGGILVLTVDSFTYRDIETRLRERHKKDHHVVNYYSRSQLSGKLENAGFKVCNDRYFVNSPLSGFFFKLGIIVKFGHLYKLIFPIAYCLSLISDRFWCRKDEGYLLAAKAIKPSPDSMAI